MHISYTASLFVCFFLVFAEWSYLCLLLLLLLCCCRVFKCALKMMH